MDYRVNEEAPYEMTAMQKAWKILRAAKKGTRVVAIIPPAVRTAIGEYFAFARGEDAFGKIAAALREIGADVVADGALGTDFAVGKAAKTLSERLTSGEKLPLVLSSPAWAEAMKEKYPEAAENVAVFTPALQFAALIRKYFNALGDGKKTKVIIVAPCKVESEEDILVLTTRELAVMFQSADINVRMLKNSAADEPFVSFSGAGVLPAVAGGLAESVVRGLLEDKSEESFKKLEYSGLRSRKSLREARIFCGGKTVKVAVAYEGEAADALAERIFAGGAEYDLVEIAECAGGCIMGEGQSCADERTEKLRAAGIYRLDRLCKTKSSMQNVSVAWLEALTLAEPAPEPAEPEYEEEPIPESAPAAVEIAPLYKAEEPTAEASDPTPEVKAPIAGTEEAAEEKEEGDEAEEALILEAAEAAWDAGIVVVAASGNKGPADKSITVPGSSRKVITVGAYDDCGKVCYSGRGPTRECICKPDLCAPGSGILSTAPLGAGRGLVYQRKSGTSMAAPVVSGAAALLLEKYPDLTNVEVKIRMKESAEDLGLPKNWQGWGRIHIGRLTR